VGAGMVETLSADVVRQLLGDQAGVSSVSNRTDGGALAVSEEISGTEVEGNPG
jgi:hypothetical protein